ncbi:MAG: putative bifunctional diguanylate cyclase/phosphodiesterase [Acidimicrobiales bacterium]|jgi:diguanylate cyclase (GGDEF)-like protein/PAS domain S-box-containing protein
MQSGFAASVTVAALATQRQALPDSLTCREVDEWFRQDNERRSAVLERSDGSAKLINRSAFYQTLLGPMGFGWALYAKEPAALLPAPAGLTVRGDMLAVDAAMQLMAEEISSNDDLLVIGGSAPTTISTSAILAQLARAQTEQAGRLEALLQNVSEVILVVDENGIICYTSSSGREVGWYQAAEQVGRSCLDNVHVDDRATVQRLLLLARRSPRTTIRDEVRLRGAKGGYLLIAVAVTDQRAHAGIGGLVLTYQDISERHAFEQKLRHLALHDGLTGLANRLLLQDRVMHALAVASRSGDSVALLYIDLDGFKKVNDGWGHASGDAVLQAVGAALKAQTRAGDTVARMGGDEFVILLEQLRTPTDASAFASRIHQALEEIVIDGLHIKISCSVGVASADEFRNSEPAGDSSEAEELIRRADAAMYLAKSEGCNRTRWWEESIEQEAAKRHRLSAELAFAAERDELRLHYQPIVNVDDGSVCGLEALVRWQHPTDGLIPPGVFIPLAERNGAITAITQWVLQQACKDGNDLLLQREAPLSVAVNLSAVELARPRLAEDVARVLSATGFPAWLLELEITETALITNFALARSSITGLKALGVTIAIDDFGTGYSSLSYLHELPVDRVKIDKTFTDRVTEEDGASLIRGVIDLAHSLHLRVTAEGIETAPQAEALARFRCDQGQGFFHAYPVPIEELDVTPSTRSPQSLSLVTSASNVVSMQLATASDAKRFFTREI